MMPQESTLQEEDVDVEFRATTKSNKRKRDSLHWKHLELVYTKDVNGKIINSIGICIYCKDGVKANTKLNGSSSLI